MPLLFHTLEKYNRVDKVESIFYFCVVQLRVLLMRFFQERAKKGKERNETGSNFQSSTLQGNHLVTVPLHNVVFEDRLWPRFLNHSF